jgi:hypothetical protein
MARRSFFPFSDETKWVCAFVEGVGQSDQFPHETWKKQVDCVTKCHPQHEDNWVEEGFNDSIDGRTETPPVRAH